MNSEQQYLGWRRVEQLIGWSFPCPGCIKVNSDGKAKGNPSLVGARVVIQDAEGIWISGKVVSLGVSLSIMAKVWGAFIALNMAWDLDFRQVILELDSLIIVNFLQSNLDSHHPCFPMLWQCKQMLARDWIVHINHMYKEGN